jgi:CheY-like chemotaxis protein
LSLIAVFSDNRETESIYLGVANSSGAKVLFKEKNRTALESLLGLHFDALIVEITQPAMSEIDFVDQLSGLVPDAPIIVVSQFFYDTRDIVFGDKIADFILKPLNLDKIEESLAKIAPGFTPTGHVAEIVHSNLPAETKVTNAAYEGKKLSVLLEMSRDLNSVKDFDDLLHRIIVLATDALNSERATLFIVDKKKKELWSRTGIGIEKQEIRFPMDRGIAGEVALSGEAQIIDEPYSHPKFNKEIDIKTGFVTRNILTLAMKNINGDVIGVFQILNKKEGSFTKEDQSFLSAMSVNTGIALENALLREELKKQLDDVKHAYDELYIAQNAILKETKIVTYSEIESIVRELTPGEGTGADTNKITREIRRIYPFDPQLKKYLDQIDAYKGGDYQELIAILEDKRKSLLR